MFKNKITYLTFFIFIIIFISCSFFFFLYHYDNKYNTKQLITQENCTLLSDNTKENASKTITWLVHGWKLYPDQLILSNSNSSIPLYIGQYSSLSTFHKDQSPYGVATYQTTLQGNGTYILYIPEIFSACKIYVNGKLCASSGSFSPYKAHIKDMIVPVTITNQAEIIIQTMNYTHYYTGLTYPPAIGSCEAIQHLILTRMLYYGFLVVSSFTLSIFSSVIWLGFKNNTATKQNLWLGVLAFIFSLRLCYPFVHIFGLPFNKLLYCLEDTLTALGFFCILQIIVTLCLHSSHLGTRILTGISLGFVFVCMIVPTFVLPTLPGFTFLYGQLIFWYKGILCLILLFFLLRYLMQSFSKAQSLLLIPLLFYSIALGAHVICLGTFEPARFGWFEEWGIYVLILFFASRMAFTNIKIIRENIYLNENLEKEVAEKTKDLSILLEERRALLSTLSHDLKTPITSITTFTRLIEMDNLNLDSESLEYLTIIRKKSKEMNDRLYTLNEFNHLDSAASLQPINLCELITEFYKSNKPDFDVFGIHVTLSIDFWGKQCFIRADKNKILSILQNLIYNALDFTPKNGNIDISVKKQNGELLLSIEDTGIGIAQEHLPHIFDYGFSLRQDTKSHGIGLYLVKSMVMEHGGKIDVESTVGKGSRFTITFPLKL